MVNWAFAILFPLCCLLVAVILALLVPLDDKNNNTQEISKEKIQSYVLLETLLKSSHNVPRVADILEQ